MSSTETKVSTNGNVALPGSICRKLGIEPGDRLDADVIGDTIVLSPKSKSTKKRKARIVKSSTTGLPVIDAGDNAPILTSEMVSEMLSDFP